MCTRSEDEEVNAEEDALYIVGEAPPKVFILFCVTGQGISISSLNCAIGRLLDNCIVGMGMECIYHLCREILCIVILNSATTTWPMCIA